MEVGVPGGVGGAGHRGRPRRSLDIPLPQRATWRELGGTATAVTPDGSAAKGAVHSLNSVAVPTVPSALRRVSCTQRFWGAGYVQLSVCVVLFCVHCCRARLLCPWPLEGQPCSIFSDLFEPNPSNATGPANVSLNGAPLRGLDVYSVALLAHAVPHPRPGSPPRPFPSAHARLIQRSSP